MTGAPAIRVAAGYCSSIHLRAGGLRQPDLVDAPETSWDDRQLAPARERVVVRALDG
jgi:hypothetical protein